MTGATTTSTTKLGTSPDGSLVHLLRRAGSAIRRMVSALAGWRPDLAAGQLGPDPETVIGRATGARI